MMTKAPPDFISLHPGYPDFAASGGEYVQLSNANGRVTADAIKLVYADPLPPANNATNLYYLHTDHLGTPRTATDANQKLIWRWDSDPYGLGAANDDPDNDGVKVTLNLRFPGQYFDAESGLHYNYHRYYDPLTGRYVTSDPIGLEGGLNTYGYVYQNPIRYFDLLGLQGLPCTPLLKEITNCSSNYDYHVKSVPPPKSAAREEIKCANGLLWYTVNGDPYPVQLEPGNGLSRTWNRSCEVTCPNGEKEQGLSIRHTINFRDAQDYVDYNEWRTEYECRWDNSTMSRQVCK